MAIGYKRCKEETDKNQIFALIKLVTADVLGAIELETQVLSDYKESEFFRKYIFFVSSLPKTVSS